MIDAKGKRRCDRQVMVKDGWKSCFRPAKYQSVERISGLSTIVLDYCDLHKPKIDNPLIDPTER